MKRLILAIGLTSLAYIGWPIAQDYLMKVRRWWKENIERDLFEGFFKGH